MWEYFLRRKRPGIEDYLKWLRRQDGDIALFHSIKPKEARYGPFGDLDPEIIASLKKVGIESLYSHQSLAFSLASSGKDIVVATPTASGKTLCYDLPVLNSIVKDGSRRSLYLFPTKALAQDQLAGLRKLSASLPRDISSFTYDGDTPPAIRKEIKSKANIIITNPDMLNTAILPHHQDWGGYFRGLDFIVVDELHTYRGVLGSHLANLFVRLLRICRHYGSDPVFICSSATIANPAAHARLLTGRTSVLIEESGAPSAQKELIIYDPVMIDRKKGIRRSSLYEAGRLALKAISSGISSILFTRSRINVELLVKAISEQLAAKGMDTQAVKGYRSGYLPSERRDTERRLREGRLGTVVSTNALELGVDIGALDLVLIHGFPGSIASVRQQIGRAGRRNALSAAVIITSSLPLDRYLAKKPEWLLGASPERARIAPSNPYIRLEHIKCSVFEIPFRANETFGGEKITEILEFLSGQGVLKAGGDKECLTYSWGSSYYPASSFSMRNVSGDKYSIFDITDPGRPVLKGTMDKHSAGSMLFPGAVYLHNGKTYLVDELDPEKMECRIKRSFADIYTESRVHLRTNIIGQIGGRGLFGWGETRVSTVSAVYKTIDIKTRKTLGHGEVRLPEEQMETTSLWIKIPDRSLLRPGLQPAMDGLSNLLKNLAPVFLMCDSSDIRVSTAISEPFLCRPAIFISDAMPGGVGLAEGAYDSIEDILEACLDRLDSCICSEGCPSCTGADAGGKISKRITGELIEDLLMP